MLRLKVICSFAYAMIFFGGKKHNQCTQKCMQKRRELVCLCKNCSKIWHAKKLKIEEKAEDAKKNQSFDQSRSWPPRPKLKPMIS